MTTTDLVTRIRKVLDEHDHGALGGRDLAEAIASVFPVRSANDDLLAYVDKSIDNSVGQTYQWENDEVMEMLGEIRALAARQPSEDDREALAVARNIINQIGDLWYEKIPSDRWVTVRQETNGQLDQFVASLVLGFSRATVPDAATEIARKLAEGAIFTGADAAVIAEAAVKVAASGEIAEAHALCDGRLLSVEKHAERMEAERDAARAAIERVRAIHVRTAFEDAPDKYHCKRCQVTAGTWPCPTVAALDRAPEPEGNRMYAACWRDDNGYLNSLESATVLRDYAEADVKKWRGYEQGEPNGQPDRVVLASRMHYPWLPVEGESSGDS